jgi:serine/threonine-protein kinase HSL1 (negative regulator of Swe1 kinase)
MSLVTIEPVSFSPDLSGASLSSTSGPSPKRSWFNNLFSFKPAPCTLVSHLNISETRERTKKLLAGMNVRTAVVEIDGLRGLKCRVDEVRDNNGMSSTKGVRFRVEFSRGASSPSGVGYNTLVSLTLEKGAQSSFKEIFGSLRYSFGDTQSQSPTSARPPVQQAHSFSLPSASARPHASSISNGSTYGANGNGNGNAPHLSAPHMRWTSSAPNTPIMPSSPQFPSNAPGSVRLPSAIRF